MYQHRSRTRYVAVAVVVSLTGLEAAAAQPTTDPPGPPSTSEFAGPPHFAFLIGEWDIDFKSYDVSTGAVRRDIRAFERAVYLNGGTLIFDEWTGYSRSTGEVVSHGVTLRTWADSMGQWQNVYLASGQGYPATPFWGEWRDGEIHAYGLFDLDDGRSMRFWIRFFGIHADRYAWEEQWSLDGETWTLAKEYRARRRSDSP